MIDPTWVRAELAAIRATKESQPKGARLEALLRHIFCAVPGLALDDQDVMNAYETEEIDLFFWNERDREGLHFLDCPLIVECKGWSQPVPGEQLRYFATVLKDRGRSNGIFVALEGITGSPEERTAGFYHIATAMSGGQTVLVITGADVQEIETAEDLIVLLRRRMIDQVKGQVLTISGNEIKSGRAANTRRRSRAKREK